MQAAPCMHTGPFVTVSVTATPPATGGGPTVHAHVQPVEPVHGIRDAVVMQKVASPNSNATTIIEYQI
ncbi:unnamed protein product [Sphagnum balticum]